MPTAACVIRPLPEFRRDAFVSGLERCGYEVVAEPLRNPRSDDLLVVWNRTAVNDKFAQRYERVGATVIVTENGYLGREWRGGKWYALALKQHNGAGLWLGGGPERWSGWNVDLAPWRSDGNEIVILAQRGIGSPQLRSPRLWESDIARSLRARTKRPVRIRAHPGKLPEAISLAEDLKSAWACVTWASAAGLKAIVHGVPVFHACPTWIGKGAAVLLDGADLEKPFLGDRLPMLQRLAWSMFNTDEIATGEPFRCLLELRST